MAIHHFFHSVALEKMSRLPTLGQLILIDSSRRRSSIGEIKKRDVSLDITLPKTTQQPDEKTDQSFFDSSQKLQTFVDLTFTSPTSSSAFPRLEIQVTSGDGSSGAAHGSNVPGEVTADADESWQGPGIDTVKTIFEVAAKILPPNAQMFKSDITIKYNLTGGFSHWSHNPDGALQIQHDFDGLNVTSQVQKVRDVFNYLSNALNISFVEDNKFTDFADLGDSSVSTFSQYNGYISFGDISPYSFASVKHSSIQDSRYSIINLGDGSLNNDFNTILHEIGHVIGLRHPGSYNYNPNGTSITFEGMAEFYNDTDLLSVMSYFTPNNMSSVLTDYENPNIFGSHMNQATLMPADYIALRARYGVQQNSIAHGGFNEQKIIGVNTTITPEDSIWNQVESYITENRYFYTQVANHNEDTVDFSNTTEDQKIDLRVTSGDDYDAFWSNIGGGEKNLAFSEVSWFEIAKSGGGDDILIGNEANNALFGNDGDDHLTGWDGDDDLVGGWGDDELFGGFGNDLLIAGEGDDFLHDSTGINEMYGGLGKDTFYLKQGLGHNTIHDFSGMDDQIQLGDGADGVSIINHLDGSSQIYQNGDLLGIVNGKSADTLEVSGTFIVGVNAYM